MQLEENFVDKDHFVLVLKFSHGLKAILEELKKVESSIMKEALSMIALFHRLFNKNVKGDLFTVEVSLLWEEKGFQDLIVNGELWRVLLLKLIGDPDLKKFLTKVSL